MLVTCCLSLTHRVEKLMVLMLNVCVSVMFDIYLRVVCSSRGDVGKKAKQEKLYSQEYSLVVW